MSHCIFCEKQLNTEDKCVWCGFSQNGGEAIPGTLSYGTKLKSYIIGNVIGIDGESTSYLAFDRKTQQKVFIKEFLPVTMIAPRQGNEVSVQPGKQVLFKNLLYDFTDLYATLQKIESPAMPKIFDIFTENKTAYAVMECINGVPLKDFLIKRGKPFTFKEIRWTLDELFRLVDSMSKLNLHHGGISDETVMITNDGALKLTGFAIQDLRTKNEHLAYKLYDGFSAPEQYHSDRFQGVYTDIYALACLVYYAVTGRTMEKLTLEGKEIYRIFPKYAVEALRYATKESPRERLDSVEDFVMMLDDKGTVIKQKPQPVKETDKKKIMMYAGIALAAVIILILAFTSISGNGSGETSTDDSQSISQSQPEQNKTVPSFLGKYYADVISDKNYQSDYVFVKLESYSAEYSEGKICQQSPKAGEKLEPGTTIYLTVSLGPRAVKVPAGIIGISYDDAVEILDKAGIAYRKEYVDQTREYVYGMVADLSIDEGEEMDIKKDVLIVYVANDKPFSTPTPKPTPEPTPTSEPTAEPTPDVTPTPQPTDGGTE